jgi:hypothetical protein
MWVVTAVEGNSFRVLPEVHVQRSSIIVALPATIFLRAEEWAIHRRARAGVVQEGWASRFFIHDPKNMLPLRNQWRWYTAI